MNKVKIYGSLILVLIVGFIVGKWIYQPESGSEHNHQETEMQLWTCSMHPQIEKTEPGDCPICGMDLIRKDQNENTLNANAIQLSENELILGNIQTSFIGSSSNSSTIELEGEIVQNEKLSSVQTSHLDGRIEKLYINYTGEKIKRGSPLAKIYAPELVIAQEELLLAYENKDAQPRLFEISKNKLKRWKISEKQINTIIEKGEAQTNFTIYADQSGYVTQKNVNEGQYIKAGEELLIIAPLHTVWATFDVYENQIAAVHVGQKIAITVSNNPNLKYTGTIDFINPTLTDIARINKVRITLKNPDLTLKPGMLLKGSIQADKNKNANSDVISIPKSAVLWTGKYSIVYVKTASHPDAVFEAREIELGSMISDNFYTVENGLVQSEEIVTNGVFTIDASAQLSSKKSMLNKRIVHHKKGVISDYEKLTTIYLEIKNELVKSDFKKAKVTVQKGIDEIQSLTKIPNSKNMDTLEKDLKKLLISSSLEVFRSNFEIFSNDYIQFAKQNTVSDQTLYIQFCPMVGANGAYWLSKSDQVLNPYFGEKMLRCGTVKNKII